MARNRDRFPRATGMGKGYRREQVDGWLNRVETAMRLADGVPTVSSAEVRRVGFDLVRRGYDVAAVDAHLDRLEELAVAAEAEGEASMGRLTGSTGGTAEAERLTRDLQTPDGERFAHAPLLTRGYDPRDVDAFVEDVLLPGLTGAAPLPAVEQVRSVVFRARRGGYDEGAVDDALDAVVDHLLRRDRVGAVSMSGSVPAHIATRPAPALARRAEPDPAAPSAAPQPGPAIDSDDAWAVDGWLPEPHRGRPLPPASGSLDAASAARDDAEATVVWPGGLPAQGAAEQRHHRDHHQQRQEPGVDPAAHDDPQDDPHDDPHDDPQHDPREDPQDRDLALERERVRGRTSTGTGWPG